MTVLKNGATLILEELISTGESVVLATTDLAYVTWLKDNEGNCSFGNYFPKLRHGLHSAIDNFEYRVGRF